MAMDDLVTNVRVLHYLMKINFIFLSLNSDHNLLFMCESNKEFYIN